MVARAPYGALTCPPSRSCRRIPYQAGVCCLLWGGLAQPRTVRAEAAVEAALEAVQSGITSSPGAQPRYRWGAAAARVSAATRAMLVDVLGVVLLLRPVVRALNTARFPATSSLFLLSALTVLGVFRVVFVSLDLYHSRWLLEREDKNAHAAWERIDITKARMLSQVPHDLFAGSGEVTYQYKSAAGEIESSSFSSSIRSPTATAPALTSPAPHLSPTACHLIPDTVPRVQRIYSTSELTAVRSYVDSGMVAEFGVGQYAASDRTLPQLAALADEDGDGNIIGSEILEFGYAVLPSAFASQLHARRLIRQWLWC